MRRRCSLRAVRWPWVEWVAVGRHARRMAHTAVGELAPAVHGRGWYEAVLESRELACGRGIFPGSPFMLHGPQRDLDGPAR